MQINSTIGNHFACIRAAIAKSKTQRRKYQMLARSGEGLGALYIDRNKAIGSH